MWLWTHVSRFENMAASDLLNKGGDAARGRGKPRAPDPAEIRFDLWDREGYVVRGGAQGAIQTHRLRGQGQRARSRFEEGAASQTRWEAAEVGEPTGSRTRTRGIAIRVPRWRIGSISR